MDYNEILCQAIDTIISQRISEIGFDKTIICTIIDDSKKGSGEYLVTDGSLTFWASCDSDKYRSNHQVYVTIPMGDYSQKKVIVGRFSSEEDNYPLVYVSPLEKIVPVVNLYSNKDMFGLIANDAMQAISLGNFPCNCDVNADTISISADFKCLLQDYLVTEGNYGLGIILTSTNNESAYFELDCKKDMFGNPYAYTTFLTQSQTYRLDFTGLIDSIQIYFYQRGNFSHIEILGEDATLLNPSIYNNIFVRNIDISLGYDTERIEDNTVRIQSVSTPSYNIEEGDNVKKLTLYWYNKDENNKYLGFSDGVFAETEEEAKAENSGKYYIKWEHSNNNGDWSPIPEGINKTSLDIAIEPTWLLNEYRATVYYSGNFYRSNILQFRNAAPGSDAVQNALQMSLTLLNGENGQDAYPLYGSDGSIINPADSTLINRSVYFVYDSTVGGTLENDVLDGATVCYYIPLNATMLQESYFYDGWTKIAEGATNYRNGYAGYSKVITGETQLSDKIFTYRIKQNYNPLFINNTIILFIIDKNGFEYTTSKSFNFSSYGTSGTDFTVIVSAERGENVSIESSAIKLQAQLYDANYKEIPETTFEWRRYPNGEKTTQEIAAIVGEYSVVQATAQVDWASGRINISGLCPISYAKSDEYVYQGPVTIMYDSAGSSPNYYRGDICLFDRNNNVIECNWEISYYSDIRELIKDTKYAESWGKLTQQDNVFPRFKPSPIYLGEQVLLALVAKNAEGEVLWQQPLIILQNQYASALLNNWNGDLIVDNENNYILSAMLGAGTKNNQNQFSGVLMGDITKADSDITRESGLFGYHEGGQSFGFKTDGTAFIGKKGAGRIEFNGNNGFIQSGNYKSKEAGMRIDLANGSIDAKNFTINEDGNATFRGEIKATKLIIEEGAETNIPGGEEYGDEIEAIGSKLNSWSYVEGSSTTITGNNITTGFIDASKLAVDYIKSKNCIDPPITGFTGGGTFIDLINGGIYSTNFYIDDSGNAKFRGEITATSLTLNGNAALTVKSGNNTIFNAAANGSVSIAGFVVDNNSISTGDWSTGKGAKIFISTGTSGSYSICGHKTSGWLLGARDTFGITSEGVLYAKSAVLQGSLTATFVDLSQGVKADSLGEYQIGKYDEITTYSAQVTITQSVLSNKSVTFTAVLNKSGHTAPLVFKHNVTYKQDSTGKTVTKTNTFHFPVGSTSASYNLTDVSIIQSFADEGEAIIETSTSGVAIKANFVPATDNEYYCGLAPKRWKAVYATNGTIQTSDERLKNITSITNDYETVYDSITPILFTWRNDSDNKYHFGYSAQNIQSALYKLPSDRKYGIVNDSSEQLGLNYSQLIALNTWQIKKLKERIALLEEQLSNKEKKELC